LILANFGGCYGCAIGFSITAGVEIVYWIFIKPIGLEKKKQCKHCTHHHYNSSTHKRIVRIVQGTMTSGLIIFSGWRFYLVTHHYLYLPIPEENRNQITPNYESNFSLNFWEYLQ